MQNRVCVHCHGLVLHSHHNRVLIQHRSALLETQLHNVVLVARFRPEMHSCLMLHTRRCNISAQRDGICSCLQLSTPCCVQGNIFTCPANGFPLAVAPLPGPLNGLTCYAASSPYAVRTFMPHHTSWPSLHACCMCAGCLHRERLLATL